MLEHPDWSQALRGFIPTHALMRDAGMLWLAAGILGAIVMPHNLYLHSALVKNHVAVRDDDTIGEALRGVNIDTFASLGLAFIVNASLLVVAAAVFHASGNVDVDDLADAHRLIAPLTLARDPKVPDRLRLAPGQYRRVRYTAAWPDSARGTIKIDPVGFDASPMLVTLNRNDTQTQVVAAEHREAQAATPAQLASASAAANTAAVPTTPQDTMLSGRFSTFEPSYFTDGKNGDQLAKFQFSFKYQLHLPDDPRSRSFLDNLYFGYMQTAIWNLSADSVPFRDISFQPQVFYYVEDTGWKSPLFTRMGVAAGIGHESNGKGGDDSRAINIAFVQPTWEFGNLSDNHMTLSPKFYDYLSKSGNHDIADYRGYVDFWSSTAAPTTCNSRRRCARARSTGTAASNRSSPTRSPN